MIISATLAEARRVPNVAHIFVGATIYAYQHGDVLPAPPDNTAENSRQAGIDSAIDAGSLGTVTPATVQELKQMSAAQYSTWFDANFSTAALVLALVKLITLVVIRRVL